MCKFNVVVLCRDSRAVVSSSLQEMLVDAQQQGRLTCGIYDSGTLLAKYVLCILCHMNNNIVHQFNALTLAGSLCCVLFHLHFIYAVCEFHEESRIGYMY